ncbi:hypothetical protein Tco_0680665 [Tanacetum coccineum]|uniref:Reverse transcriptase domain-containing protein n=1 Tax=Tanacetum coccineum TaxID=301880 RepID=A0ABQ4XM17_9ASTR
MNKMLNEKKALDLLSAPVKAVEEVCVTCGSNHHFNHCPLTRGGNDFPVFHDNIQQFQQTAAVGNFLQRNQSSNLASQVKPQAKPIQAKTKSSSLPSNTFSNQGISQGNYNSYGDSIHGSPIPTAVVEKESELLTTNLLRKHDQNCFHFTPTLPLYLMKANFYALRTSFLNNDPLPSPNQGDYSPGIQKDLKVVEPQKSSLKNATSYEPKVKLPEVKLNELPPHLEYAFLEENNSLPTFQSEFQKI